MAFRHPLSHAGSSSGLAPQVRTWAMLAHLLTLLGHSLVLGSFLPPLAIWLWKRGEDDFIADQALESLNFQITMGLARVFGWLLVVTVVFSCVGVPFLVLVYVGDIVMAVVAGFRAHEGERYRYPFAFRWVR